MEPPLAILQNVHLSIPPPRPLSHTKLIQINIFECHMEVYHLQKNLGVRPHGIKIKEVTYYKYRKLNCSHQTDKLQQMRTQQTTKDPWKIPVNQLRGPHVHVSEDCKMDQLPHIIGDRLQTVL
jgi:hypothetical protein